MFKGFVQKQIVHKCSELDLRVPFNAGLEGWVYLKETKVDHILYIYSLVTRKMMVLQRETSKSRRTSLEKETIHLFNKC